jgi:Protein of unknown function (DUF3341)
MTPSTSPVPRSSRWRCHVSADPGALGIFLQPARAARAIRALKASGFDDVRAAMPAPFPEVVTAVGKPRSPVAFLALPGAVVGTVGGLALTVLTSLSLHLVTGGKPVVSVPPFVIIAFELAVLIGSLANLGAVALGAWHGGKPSGFPQCGSFNGARIGVFAACRNRTAASRILRENGAEEVTDVP